MISAKHSFWFCSVYPKGATAALPAFIHARLHGCAGSSCPEQNHTTNPNCMLIVSCI